MYNKKFKDSFLSEYPKRTAGTYIYDLKRVSQREEMLDKNVYDFTYEEMDDMFKSMHYKTLASARRSVSTVSEYVDFANRNGKISSKIDISQLFRKDKLKEYVWKYAYLESFVTRDEMYEMTDMLYNYSDKLPIILSFEGIKGEELIDMINLKFSDINFKTGECKLITDKPSVIIKDRRSLDLIQESKNESEYHFKNGEATGRVRVAELMDTDYVLKKTTRPNSNNEVEIVTVGFLEAKMTRIFKGMGEQEPFIPGKDFVNLTSLFKSGIFDKVREVEKSLKLTKIGGLDFIEIVKTRGLDERSAYRYKTEYDNYKEYLSI